MSQASLFAYQSIIEKLPERRRKVFEAVARWTPGGGATCKTLAGELGLARDSVSPRIGELKNAGAIIECGEWKGETVYKINPEPPILWEKPTKRPRALYRKAIADAAKAIDAWLQDRGELTTVRYEAMGVIQALAK